ncbi:T9SS type A sorting domain-containing protein [Prevotella sp. OH937_COT-195]|uniref:T9SS type A sorting domain-containing protein n=1 Tax=Prevotella sp. OH937_COT-195 TaxID=2491051 RepID=UPI000F650FB6|nr:carbohydrate binding domain-containing protein [Prevotella sp. OH937_COT-195]RRC99442.1 hypothetical protein EII32_07935 [Prevotella sp. OH937_COT-195]
MKGKLSKLFALTCVVMFSVSANAGIFTIVENFDDQSHFTTSENLPDGWKSEGTYAFSRNTGTYFGIVARSGDYIFATPSSMMPTRNEVIYTPLKKIMAGKPCKISFYVYAPGGNPPAVRMNSFTVKAGKAQEMDAQTIEVLETPKRTFPDWTLLEGTFTPDDDAEYCFSISLASSLTSCGIVAIDDVEITGEEPSPIPDPDPDPDPANLAEAITPPYSQSFDNENNDYDGTTYVPAKWIAMGTNPFITANSNDLPAVTGTYYIVSPPSVTMRNDVLFTPYFSLKKDVECIITFYTHLSGNGEGKSTLDFLAGTGQTLDLQKSIYTLADHSNFGWELNTVRFTPKKDGAYCFSFLITSPELSTGLVALEDFKVTTAEIEALPKPSFYVDALYDITESTVVLSENQSLKIYNLTENATSYEWTIEPATNEFVSNPVAKDAELKFTDSGSYTISLNAQNEYGEKKMSRELNIEIVEIPTLEKGLTKQGSGDATLARGKVPTLSTSEWDFITGPTHYYRNIAERFEVSEENEVNIKTLNLILTNLRYKPNENSYDDQYNGKFEVIVCGEKDGKIDESNVFGRYTSTMAKTFGTTGVPGNWGIMKGIVFAEPVKVKGNFYLVFSYPDNFDLDIDDINVGSSYLGLAALEYVSGATTLMVKPDSVPENSGATVGEWCTIDKLDNTQKGNGLWLTMWVDIEDGSLPTGVYAIDNKGNVVFDVCTANDGFIVSGVKDGEQITVFDVDGRKVASALSVGRSTFIPFNGTGVYVVKSNEGTRKLVKK